MLPTFLFFILAIASANLIPTDETVIDEEIVLNNNSNLDVSANVNNSPTETKTVGGESVILNKEFKFNSDSGNNVLIQNSQLTSVLVEIPDQSLVKAPDTWNGIITPPKSVTTVPIEISGFNTPTSAITIGSPDVILVFDKAVTILLTATTGQTAYKTPGSNNWILISGCTGTYANPNDPAVNGECAISNGIDTKILTFHFTEFTGLTTTPASTPEASTPSTSTSNSGGHGNTGVGSPRIFGSSGGSSGGGYNPGTTQNSIFPSWFDNVTDWYREGKISAIEYLKAYQWLVENVL